MTDSRKERVGIIVPCLKGKKVVSDLGEQREEEIGNYFCLSFQKVCIETLITIFFNFSSFPF